MNDFKIKPTANTATRRLSYLEQLTNERNSMHARTVRVRVVQDVSRVTTKTPVHSQSTQVTEVVKVVHTTQTVQAAPAPQLRSMEPIVQSMRRPVPVVRELSLIAPVTHHAPATAHTHPSAPVPVVVPTSAPRPQPELAAALPASRPSKKKFKLNLFKKSTLIYGSGTLVVAAILALTGYVSIDTWLTSKEVKQVVASPQQAPQGTLAVAMGEGQDEAQVTSKAIDSYAVAPDLPRVLSIESLNVQARILPMSVNTDGSMQAPVNIFDSGWYAASSKPGQPGASFINAHASGPSRQGLFAYLDTLTMGDTIAVQKGDGTTLNYRVVRVETVALDQVDMAKVLQTYNGAAEGLNLMTCTGKWLPDDKTFDHRVIVYTERV